jgi:hypothetical protein
LERGVNFVTDRKDKKSKRGRRGEERGGKHRKQKSRSRAHSKAAVTNEERDKLCCLFVNCNIITVTLYSCWSNQPTNQLKEKGWMMPVYLRFFFFFLPPFSFLVFPAESEEDGKRGEGGDMGEILVMLVTMKAQCAFTIEQKQNRIQRRSGGFVSD